MSGFQISMLLLTFSIAMFVFSIIVCIVGTVTKERREVEKRIEKMKPGIADIGKKIKDKREARRIKIENKAKSGQSLKRKKLMDTIFNELVLADILMGPEEFTMIWIVITFVPGALVALLGFNPIASIGLGIIGALGPIIIISIKKNKRRKAFEAQLSDALMVICNCLRSGLSFQQSIETIANDMPAPLGVEFSRVVSEINYGETMEEALNNMVRRIKSPDLMIAISAVSVQRQTGGNLSKILDTISCTIRDRLKIKSEISALTAQGRTSGMLIGALPVMILFMLMVISPDYVETFFATKTGNIMLAVAAVMEIIGFFAIRKVVTIEY